MVTARVAYAIQQGVSSESLLVITFTNKASGNNDWDWFPRLLHKLFAAHGIAPSNPIPILSPACTVPYLKAAEELKERLKGVLGSNLVRGLSTGTFHATCARILR